ncbi:MAG: response regulator [Saprospiraceae bacterium]|nr:response regulator [Saprospiraceae bacterium]
MKRRVLVVDDHDGFRNLIGNFLSKKFEVISAKNGLDAMTVLNKGLIPDIIVTDTRMPEINGEQLLYNLRCSGMYGNIPVWVMSEHGREEEEVYFRNLGASGYLRKPFNPTVLQEQLSKFGRADQLA